MAPTILRVAMIQSKDYSSLRSPDSIRNMVHVNAHAVGPYPLPPTPYPLPPTPYPLLL